MKLRLYVILFLFTNALSTNAQVAAKQANESQPLAEATPELTQEQLLQKMNDIQAAYERLIKVNDDQFAGAKLVLNQGLGNAAEIESLLPSTLLLLDYNDLRTLVSKVNNPAEDKVGLAFTDVVINSAAENLLPQYPDEEKLPSDQTSKSKFKSFLSSIVKSPVLQSLLNTNPITSIVNTVLQQTLAYEKPQEISFTITGTEISAALPTKKTPGGQIVKSNSIANRESPYDNLMLEKFYNSLKERIEFYDLIRVHIDSVEKLNYNLRIEAIALQRQVKTGKTAICALLNIKPDNYITELTELYKKGGILMNEKGFQKNDCFG